MVERYGGTVSDSDRLCNVEYRGGYAIAKGGVRPSPVGQRCDQPAGHDGMHQWQMDQEHGILWTGYDGEVSR